MAVDALERSFDSDGAAALRVRIPGGDVQVRAEDGSRVTVEVTPLRGGARTLERVEIDGGERGGRLEVTVEARDQDLGIHLGRRGASLRVRLTCPSGSSLELESAAADLRADGPLGALRVRTASGDVRADDVESLTVQSASGDVTARAVAGAAVVKTTSGDVEVRSVGGDLVVAVVSGDVDVGSLAGALQVTTVSGDVSVGELGASATVNGVSGDVELGVAAGRRLWLDVRSATGDVRSDFDLDDEQATGDAQSAEIVVRTVSGDVRLHRAR